MITSMKSGNSDGWSQVSAEKGLFRRHRGVQAVVFLMSHASSNYSPQGEHGRLLFHVKSSLVTPIILA